MPTATYFRTLMLGNVTGISSPSVTIDTGSDTNLQQGDTFEAPGVLFPTVTYTYQGLVTVAAVGGGTTTGFYATSPLGTFLFTLADPASFEMPDFSSGDTPICFLPGTLIATPSGEKPIEDLCIGDHVVTASGRIAPVRWIGRQTVSTLFRDPLRTLPIRIRAGAFGDGLPKRDLLASAAHAFLLDGILVNAGALVNGTSILRETAMPQVFTYHNIELAEHDLILAEGTPAETFVDNVDRRSFDNAAEHEALYGDVSIAEMDLPRAASARQVPAALRNRLTAVAESLFGQDAVAA
jgi:hypothetical protein